MSLHPGTEQSYLKEQQQLTPHGYAWNREEGSWLTGLFRGLALVWAKVHNRALGLIEEADPYTTYEMLTDWERALGLPDKCSQVGATLLERRRDVILKLNDEGRQDLLMYYEVAWALGYDITIKEYKPFIAGIGRCGQRLNGGWESRYVWHVIVHGPRIVRFRTGQSANPEKLLTIRRATDLECRFNEWNQSHADLIFEYE